jgi:hypothetical protein
MFGQKRLALERGEVPLPLDWTEVAGLSSVLVGSANVIAFLAIERWTAVRAMVVCLVAIGAVLPVAGKSHHDRWLIRAAVWVGIISGAVLVPTGLLEMWVDNI